MKNKSDPSSAKERLREKYLLTIKETCSYLGLSRRNLETLEHNDPSFPHRKTKTKHSRQLLDDWLRRTAAPWWEQKEGLKLRQQSEKFRLSIDQLN